MIKRVILLVLDVHGKLVKVYETEHAMLMGNIIQSRGVATCTEAWIAALRPDIQQSLSPIDPAGNLHYGEPANVRPNQIGITKIDRRLRQFRGVQNECLNEFTED